MRTFRSETQSDPSATPTWEPPARRYTGGGRAYACPVCQDLGRVCLPHSKVGETDDELLCMTDGRNHHTYLCPACRPAELRRRMYEVARRDDAPEVWYEEQVARLDRWLALQRARLQKPAQADTSWRESVLRAFGTVGPDAVARIEAVKRERLRRESAEAAKPKDGKDSLAEVVEPLRPAVSNDPWV